MTLNELKYIVAVGKEKHFRKASESCFVSQPTLSVAIKKLEEELGVSIFERRKQDVIITPIGKQILSIAEEILERSQEIKQVAQESQGDLNSELRIGAIYTIGPYILPNILSLFQTYTDKVPLIIEENYTHVLAEKLQRGDIDIAILSLPFEEPNIETEVIYEETFQLIVPNNHPLAKEPNPISIEQIKEENIFILGAGHCFRDQVVEAFPQLMHLNYQSDRLQKTFEGSSLETIRYMVASGAGMSIFPCTSLNQHDSSLFTIKPLQDPIPTRKVAIAWRKSFPREKILSVFKQVMLEMNLPCTISSQLADEIKD